MQRLTPQAFADELNRLIAEAEGASDWGDQQHDDWSQDCWTTLKMGLEDRSPLISQFDTAGTADMRMQPYIPGRPMPRPNHGPEIAAKVKVLQRIRRTVPHLVGPEAGAGRATPGGGTTISVAPEIRVGGPTATATASASASANVAARWETAFEACDALDLDDRETARELLSDLRDALESGTESESSFKDRIRGLLHYGDEFFFRILPVLLSYSDRILAVWPQAGT